MLLFAVAFQMEIAAQSFTPVADQYYLLKLAGADTLTLGRNGTAESTGESEDTRARVTNLDPASAQFQHIKFVATDVAGVYNIVNKDGEVLYNRSWDMWFHQAIDPTLVGNQRGYNFTVVDSPDMPGQYRIRTESYGDANRFVSPGSTPRINGATYADKKDGTTNLNWTITAAGPLSVDENFAEKGLQVKSYPNPFTGSAVVKVDGKFEYIIYNLNGVVVESGKGQESTELGSALNQGMYFLQVKQGKSITTTRLSKI